MAARVLWGDTTGMVKMLADAITDEILGVHIVGDAADRAVLARQGANPGGHVLAGLPIIDAGLRRWRGLRPSVA